MDNFSLIGRIHGVKGAFMVTGHSVWGILQGPVTGLVISELILEILIHLPLIGLCTFTSVFATVVKIINDKLLVDKEGM